MLRELWCWIKLPFAIIFGILMSIKYNRPVKTESGQTVKQ